jgi:hypothetical protein
LTAFNPKGIEAMIVYSRLVILTLVGLMSWQAASIRCRGQAPYGLPGRPQLGDQSSQAVSRFYHSLGFLRKHAAKLEKIYAGKLPQTREPLQQIQNDAAFLQEKWLAWPQRNPGRRPSYGNVNLDPYYRSLKGAQKLLSELDQAGDKQIVSTIQAVADDLHAKAENCRHSTDGLGKEIKVLVRTKKGTEETAGYEVYCAPIALVAFENEHIRFPKISSPTVFPNLAPGRYAMWLEKEGAKTEPVTQIIGGRGEKEFEIDLLVPPDSAVPK